MSKPDANGEKYGFSVSPEEKLDLLKEYMEYFIFCKAANEWYKLYLRDRVREGYYIDAIALLAEPPEVETFESYMEKRGYVIEHEFRGQKYYIPVEMYYAYRQVAKL